MRSRKNTIVHKYFNHKYVKTVGILDETSEFIRAIFSSCVHFHIQFLSCFFFFFEFLMRLFLLHPIYVVRLVLGRRYQQLHTNLHRKTNAEID